MGRTDPRSRERSGPNGVAQSFQVSLYKVDPSVGESSARSLFSKDN